MSDLDDLIVFTLAQLALDEAAAKAAAAYGANWRLADPDRSSAVESDSGSIDRIVVYDEGAPTIEQAAHIARHDPARVLREVEAKRKILAEHKHVKAAWTHWEGERPDFGCERCYFDQEDGQFPSGWCGTIRAVAAIYSDHPDYRPGWKP